MNEKDIKKLSRTDLLEMMVSLSKENEQLQKKVAQLQLEADNRDIAIENSGSIAEAALKLNGIFEAAQAACDQYTYNIRLRSESMEQVTAQMEQRAQEICDAMIAEAQKKADAIIAEAEQEARRLHNQYSWVVDLMNADGTQEDK